jgi:type II secretory pathway component GspD/PulD (secretin)
MAALRREDARIVTRRNGSPGPLVLPVLLVLFASATVRAGAQSAPAVRVESSTTGEIEFDARGVPIEEALQAIAAKAGFEVVIDEGIKRRPVNMAVPMASVEDVLRQILRGRNYALVHDADDASLRQVIVLPPPAVRRPAARRRPTRVRRR